MFHLDKTLGNGTRPVALEVIAIQLLSELNSITGNRD
jgi:hypothetical protein